MTNDPQAIFRQQYSSTSDRGSALEIFTYLESKIDSCIECLCTDKVAGQRLIKNSIKMVSAKINLLYCLGVISEGAYKDIEAIRKIRNIFAHNMLVKSFSDPIISSIIETISISPRDAVYGIGNGNENFHDEFISVVHNNFSYIGSEYLIFCQYYAGLFQVTKNHLLDKSGPLDSDPPEVTFRRSLRLPLF